jgi:hypothetical protein
MQQKPYVYVTYEITLFFLIFKIKFSLSNLIPYSYLIPWFTNLTFKMVFVYEHQKFNVRNNTSQCFTKNSLYKYSLLF